MPKTYAERQLELANQYRAQGYEAAAIDAACRATSNILGTPVAVVAQGVTSADEAIEAADRDVLNEIVDQAYSD